MAAFWILAALMLVVALAFVLVPLLRTRRDAGPTPVEANLEVLRAQRREIEADVAAGLLPMEAREEALAELVARADEDLAPSGPVAAPPSHRPWFVAAASTAGVTAVVLGVYLALGSPDALDPRPAAADAAAGMSDQQIVAMVESLAQKVKERPQDAQGWALLARSMAALGRYQESADAYAHLATLLPGDAQVFADWADSLGMAQGRSLSGRPYELAKKALELDPAHPKALALAGTAAMDAGEFAQSLRYWETMARGLPDGSADAEQVRNIIGEVRSRAAQAGKPLAAATAAAPRASAASGATITGTVAVAPEIAGRVKGGETLFIYARAEGGSRMPLAIVRGSAGDLPMKFTLDDSQAMTPQARLSSAEAVRIEARVSASGNAAPRSGDLVGTSAVVKPGAREVAVLIDKVMP